MLQEILKAGKTGIAPDLNTLMEGRYFFRSAGDEEKELTGALPLRFRSNGSDLLDWRITGAEGGAGRPGMNYLKIEPKTVNDGGSGTIAYSYIGEAPLVAPVGSPRDITYQQWIKPTYSRSTTSIYDRDIHIVTDERVPSYESSFWFADLKAGTYKLISEAYNSSAKFTYYGQNKWTVLNDPYGAQSRYPYVALYKPGSADPVLKAKILVDALSGRSGYFVHEEFSFTVDEDTRVGFFGVFPNACRFMIVDEDVQAELPVESSSEKPAGSPSTMSFR